MKFFRCYATPRSGHHSIMQWLLYQHSYVTELVPLDFGWNKKNRRKKTRRKRVIHPATLSIENYKAVLFYQCSQDRQPDITPHLDADRLILGYEDGTTPNSISYNFDIPHTNIIILRDIFNTMASVRKFRFFSRTRAKQPYPHYIMDDWLNCAKAIKNNEGYFINYNLYNHDPHYRQQLCRDLGLFFTDIGIDEVPRPGSSFTRMDKPDRKMLNQRYKMVDIGPIEEEYPEHVELSNKIFGKLE